LAWRQGRLSDNGTRSFSIAPIGDQRHEESIVFVGLDVHKDSQQFEKFGDI
jgi:hypothetical protein